MLAAEHFSKPLLSDSLKLCVCVYVCVVYTVNTDVNTNLVRMFSFTCLIWQMFSFLKEDKYVAFSK